MLIAAAVVLVALVVGNSLLGGGPEAKKLRLDEFLVKAKAGQVTTATIKDASDEVTGKLRDGTRFKVSYPARYAPEIVTALTTGKTKITTDHSSTPWWLLLVTSVGPFLIIGGLFIWYMSSQGGGGKVMQFGKSKARRLTGSEPKVTFADVAGLDEAIEELAEIKDFLAEPVRFQQMGAKIPKGVMLYGPPGTGKTLLARALAGEAGVPFFTISGSDFVEMFVGVGASRVRDLFAQAKAAAPAIIFVDEIDAVGRHRGAGMGGGHDEREQTLNQLLVEMDGFDVNANVILIASTNRPDILDPALLRPGRFDRQVLIDPPDLNGRRAILDVHAKGKPLDDSVDLDVVARRTPGFTGADLANLLNEAALLSTRRSLTKITSAEVEASIDRVIGGPERRSRIISDKDKRVIAYHEGGHALVGHVLPGTDPIHKVSIIARGKALGWTLALPTEDKYLHTRSELRDELSMLLGGRTAEELIFGDPTTGAANDIERATEIARAMVTTYGMSDRLGPRKLGEQRGEPFLGRDLGHEPNYSQE
ncbi:MAG: ATP-dependent zinc metalloprotease FtsH, partial [Dermatophilaceae bacterium]